MDNQRNQREQEQQVNQSTRDMKGEESTGPKEHKKYGDN
jgi:hypothetical protein